VCVPYWESLPGDIGQWAAAKPSCSRVVEVTALAGSSANMSASQLQQADADRPFIAPHCRHGNRCETSAGPGDMKRDPESAAGVSGGGSAPTG
jgi:hypothetical protein